MGASIPERYTGGVTGGEVIAMSRARAGLTQRELADRVEVSQAQLSRVEAGRREPSFSFVQRVTRACELEVSIRLTTADDSLHALVEQQLARTPEGRLAALVDASELPGLAAGLAAAAGADGVLIGSIAAVLVGGPGVPPVGVVELVGGSAAEDALLAAGWSPSVLEAPFGALHARQRWFAPDPATWDLELVADPAGTRGHADLVERAVSFSEIPGRVADPLDLLRIAHASPWPGDRARAAELNVILDARRPQAAAAAAAA